METPSPTTSSSRNFSLNFLGSGDEYFKVIIVNWLLTLITFGIYYPWAKERQLKFLYSHTTFSEDNFAFHGTGKEMFKGFIKAIAIILVLYGLFYALLYFQFPVPAILTLYLGFLSLIPLIIHGSYRYRMSRSSWRGIRFGYRGNLKTLYFNCLKWLFLTIITFGIYGAWFQVNLRTYLISNVRLGNMKFNFKGKGSDFFALNIIGYLLTVITLGIYIFWWQKELFDFFINNLEAKDESGSLKFRSTATGGGFFKLMITNILILIFTFGLGYAWVVTRTLKFGAKHIQISGDVDLDNLQQSEESYKDAMADDLGDLLNLDLII